MSLQSTILPEHAKRVYYMYGQGLHATHLDWAAGSELVHVEMFADNDHRWRVPDDAILYVTYDHYTLRASEILQQCNRRGIPSLTLVDGILEFRNTFQRPDSIPGNIFQPGLSSKIGCLGRSQARILESWGNLGKCEVVGFPRMDRMLNRQPRKRPDGEPFTVLIATAKTPGFTSEQMERTRQSLTDLKAWFDGHPEWNGIPIRPRWRLTAGLDEIIGVQNELRDTSGTDMATALGEVDALISTPSTSMLEGMLQGVPVAILDYHNCPHYVPAAWTISAVDHLDQVLPELVQPSEAKLLYQDTILHDALECRTPATPRVLQLVEEMVRIAGECRQRGEPVVFPDRILPDPQRGHHLPEENFDMRKLYPGHPVFSNLDAAALQEQVGHTLKARDHFKHELEALQQRHREMREALQTQIAEQEASASFRLGRALTWPLRTMAGFFR